MKTLYCIAPADAIPRYEDVCEQAGILATSFEAEGIRSLSAFLTGERAIARQDFVLIDVDDMTRWSGGTVLTAVQQLRELPALRLIVIGQQGEATEDLFRCMRELHHTDVILAPAGTDAGDALATLLEELLNGKTATEEAPPESETDPPFAPDAGAELPVVTDVPPAPVSEPPTAEPEPERIAPREPVPVRRGAYRVPEGETLHVAIAGAMPRCGTTTQAFAAYHFLTSLGLRGAIRDCAGTLPLLSRYETVSDTEDGGLRIRNVRFLRAGEDAGALDFLVSDFGVLVYDSTPAFCAADASVLVGCVKPWELPAFAAAVELTFGFDCDCFAAVASFATESELEKLGRCLGENRAAASYQPSLWRPDGGMLYGRLLASALERFRVEGDGAL